MAVVELYSQRRRRELGEASDVFQYTILSPKFRRQCLYIIADFFGAPTSEYQQIYANVVHTLRREFGLQRLTSRPQSTPALELHTFIENCTDEEALDSIDLCLRHAYALSHNASFVGSKRQKFADAFDEFNERCRSSALGYHFQDGHLIRVDSEYIHANSVKPALIVLREAAFKNANEEFRSAHGHWRQGQFSEVFIDCLKSFESTMKIIAAERSWTIPERATSSQLIQVMLENNLIPIYYQSQMTGLRTILESGIPTPRNKLAGHGAGVSSVEIPPELVRYVLHLTASTILFLVDLHKSSK